MVLNEDNIPRLKRLWYPDVWAIEKNNDLNSKKFDNRLKREFTLILRYKKIWVQEVRSIQIFLQDFAYQNCRVHFGRVGAAESQWIMYSNNTVVNWYVVNYRKVLW